jgi:hypothetical protein
VDRFFLNICLQKHDLEKKACEKDKEVVHLQSHKATTSKQTTYVQSTNRFNQLRKDKRKDS